MKNKENHGENELYSVPFERLIDARRARVVCHGNVVVGECVPVPRPSKSENQCLSKKLLLASTEPLGGSSETPLWS